MLSRDVMQIMSLIALVGYSGRVIGVAHQRYF
jgi:hypothetical protein